MTATGFEIVALSEIEFHKTYRVAEYPVPKAAQLYAQYATEIGATEDAIKALADLTPLTKDEIIMATTKKKATTDAKAAKAVKAAVGKPAAKAKAEKPAAKAKAEKPASDKKVSCAQRFRDLIVAGKMDDDAIFATVQKEYGLDDEKRRYVGFYRFDCRRKGLVK